MTNWMASVYNRESFVNITDMIAVKQVAGGVESAVVRHSVRLDAGAALNANGVIV
jgi:hypothetical protein